MGQRQQQQQYTANASEAASPAHAPPHFVSISAAAHISQRVGHSSAQPKPCIAHVSAYRYLFACTRWVPAPPAAIPRGATMPSAGTGCWAPPPASRLPACHAGKPIVGSWPLRGGRGGGPAAQCLAPPRKCRPPGAAHPPRPPPFRVTAYTPGCLASGPRIPAYLPA